MTYQDERAGTTLTHPEPNETQAPPPPTAGFRLFWPLVVLVGIALSALGVWTVNQSRVIDELTRVPSDHDSVLTQQVRARTTSGQTFTHTTRSSPASRARAPSELQPTISDGPVT